MAVSKQKFRQQVLEQIVPYLESQGFTKWKPSGRNDVPVVYFERYRQGVRDLVELGFDKHGRLAFFVDLASISGEMVETMFEGTLPTSQVTSAHLNERCRLRGGGMSQAFKPTLISRLGGVTKAAEQTASLFISNFKEAREWFEGGVVGNHIMNYRL